MSRIAKSRVIAPGRRHDRPQAVTLKGVPRAPWACPLGERRLRVAGGEADRRPSSRRRQQCACAPARSARTWPTSSGRHHRLRAQARAGRRRLPRAVQGNLEPDARLLAPGQLRGARGHHDRGAVQTEILIKGMDRQRVGQTAAVIRDIRPPEPTRARACAIRREDLPEEGKKSSPQSMAVAMRRRSVEAMQITRKIAASAKRHPRAKIRSWRRHA